MREVGQEIFLSRPLKKRPGALLSKIIGSSASSPQEMGLGDGLSSNSQGRFPLVLSKIMTQRAALAWAWAATAAAQRAH